MTTRNRQPAGRPTGGQFAPEARAGADVSLGADGAQDVADYRYELRRHVDRGTTGLTSDERGEAALDGLHLIATRRFAGVHGVKMRDCDKTRDAQGEDCPGSYTPHQHVEGFVDEWGGAVLSEDEMWEKLWLEGDDQEFRALALR